MSRVNPRSLRPINPASKHYKWAKQGLRHWDSIEQEAKAVSLPVDDLIFLEEYITITGYDSVAATALYSNVVLSVIKEILVVRTKEKIIAKGYYSQIKDQIKASGGHFTKVVYFYHDKQIITLSFKGAALYEYAEFRKEHYHDFDTHYLSLKEAFPHEKNQISYTTPVFAVKEPVDAVNDLNADSAATQVRDYFQNLAQYYQGVGTKEETPAQDEGIKKMLPASDYVDASQNNHNEMPF